MSKALSLLQPWASLVVIGAKTVETRSWNTDYRGRLLIHASKGKSGAALAAEPFLAKYIPRFAELPLTEVVRLTQLALPPALLDRLTLEERAFGAYDTGRYAWLLEDAIQYDHPVPATGALGLWDAG